MKKLFHINSIIFFLFFSFSCKDSSKNHSCPKIGAIKDSICLNSIIDDAIMNKKKYYYDELADCYFKMEHMENEQKAAIVSSSFIYTRLNKIDSVSIVFSLTAFGNKKKA